jgi:hypothetical protein
MPFLFAFSALAIVLLLAGCGSFSSTPSCPYTTVVIPELSVGDGGQTLFTMGQPQGTTCTPQANNTFSLHTTVHAAAERRQPAPAALLTNPPIFIAAIDDANAVLAQIEQRLQLTIAQGQHRAEKDFPLTATLPLERTARVYIGYKSGDRH